MPAYTRKNALDQALDIAGSLTQSDTLTLSGEADGYGSSISGQTGSAANITTVASGVATVTGLTGMSASSIGRMLSLSGAASASNNGSFLIVAVNSATSVNVSNASAVANDANNGSIAWSERGVYTLEDDLNYTRTDRKLIKGTANFYSSVPVYQRPSAVGTNVPANLANIAGKTTDAKAMVINRKFQGATVAASDGYFLLTDTGNIKHADATNRTGVPIQDGADSGADEATYVEIINPATEAALEVLADPTKRVFGRTRAGSSTSPNSVEVEFRQVAKGGALSASTAYTWEAGQPTTVDMYYGYRQTLDNLSETALRTVLTNGIVGDADSAQDMADVRTALGIADNVTSLAGLLTNTTNFFAFSDLPDGTPSVVEAFNTLNTQIGDRNYTGSSLTDGETLTQSLQALSDAIVVAVNASGIIRIVERLGADVNPGSAHTIPGAATYAADAGGAGEGQNMWVFTRGILRDPGSVVNGDDYSETSSTSVTFHARQKAGDHINYIIQQ